MNMDQQIIEKESELKNLTIFIEESMIDSQIKYIQLKEEQEQLENEIKHLKSLQKIPTKIWQKDENGWIKKLDNNE